jgi:peptide methionine sulfoxide reductase msrA/msrB
MKLNKLTPAEERVIVHKGTETPFSGEYEQFKTHGIFTCKRCNAYLYRSEDKFDAHCGWPSFDDEIIGAIKRHPDPDGKRTEITCARCGAHLGHVFLAEHFTQKNTRHCVNSISLRFIPTEKVKTSENAYFGGGCFWCVEATFKMVKGVISTAPGYAGGTTVNPTYEKVCEGDTGHAEVVKIEYDPKIISYEGLLKIFFISHDPTSLNRQGNDVGTQYRSIILYTDELQKEIAENFIKNLESEKVFSKPIVTEVTALDTFYEAEEYHHDYFAKNPDATYCQAVIAPKIAKFTRLM